MKKLILIKLGGSLITDKTKTNVARLDVIENLARQVKEIVENNKNLSLIIATGAGGFGHPIAKIYKHNLEEGRPFIKDAVKKINQIIVSSFISVGLDAVSVEPSEITKYKNGEMIELLDGYIVSLLENNIIPVFHSDLIKDQAKGISILSMDKFLVDIAIFFKNKNYKIEKIIFAGTTAGVMSRVGTTIKKITKNNPSKIREVFYKGKGVDVTGGMKYKVEQCFRLAEEEIDSYITNDLSKKGTQIK
ncbi:hypothetical protein HZA75_04220 [Candidatus Roizmanbacteria bacterium]|nr:hypothetical protein [Candidatus Roizmanbacteria bacterium]